MPRPSCVADALHVVLLPAGRVVLPGTPAALGAIAGGGSAGAWGGEERRGGESCPWVAGGGRPGSTGTRGPATRTVRRRTPRRHLRPHPRAAETAAAPLVSTSASPGPPPARAPRVSAPASPGPPPPRAHRTPFRPVPATQPPRAPARRTALHGGGSRRPAPCTGSSRRRTRPSHPSSSCACSSGASAPGGPPCAAPAPARAATPACHARGGGGACRRCTAATRRRRPPRVGRPTSRRRAGAGAWTPLAAPPRPVACPAPLPPPAPRPRGPAPAPPAAWTGATTACPTSTSATCRTAGTGTPAACPPPSRRCAVGPGRAAVVSGTPKGRWRPGTLGGGENTHQGPDLCLFPRADTRSPVSWPVPLWGRGASRGKQNSIPERHSGADLTTPR